MDRIVSFDIPHFACGISPDLSGACILCCFFPDESWGAVAFLLSSDWDPWVILHPAYAAASGPNNMWLHSCIFQDRVASTLKMYPEMFH